MKQVTTNLQNYVSTLSSQPQHIELEVVMAMGMDGMSKTNNATSFKFFGVSNAVLGIYESGTRRPIYVADKPCSADIRQPLFVLQMLKETKEFSESIDTIYNMVMKQLQTFPDLVTSQHHRITITPVQAVIGDHKCLETLVEIDGKRCSMCHRHSVQWDTPERRWSMSMDDLLRMGKTWFHLTIPKHMIYDYGLHGRNSMAGLVLQGYCFIAEKQTYNDRWNQWCNTTLKSAKQGSEYAFSLVKQYILPYHQKIENHQTLQSPERSTAALKRHMLDGDGSTHAQICDDIRNHMYIDNLKSEKSVDVWIQKTIPDLAKEMKKAIMKNNKIKPTTLLTQQTQQQRKVEMETCLLDFQGIFPMMVYDPPTIKSIVTQIYDGTYIGDTTPTIKLKVLLKQLHYGVFDFGNVPGLTGKQADGIIRNQSFHQRTKVALDNDIDARHVAHFAKLYSNIDSLYFRSVTPIDPAKVPQLCKAMENDIDVLLTYHREHLAFSKPKADYLHLMTHAPVIQLHWGKYGISLGALSATSIEFWQQGMKKDLNSHVTPEFDIDRHDRTHTSQCMRMAVVRGDPELQQMLRAKCKTTRKQRVGPEEMNKRQRLERKQELQNMEKSSICEAEMVHGRQSTEK